MNRGTISCSLALLCILSVSAYAQDTIKIATFNIQVFGESKMSKPDIVSQLADIIREYDVVAVQELKDVGQTTPHEFLALINSDTGPDYGLVLSMRTGLQPDDSSSKEQYAFYYNTDTIRPAGIAVLYNDEFDDNFQREPFMARFETVDGNFSFVLINIHTRPAAALEEIDALHFANITARLVYPFEDDIITLGDFNADGDFATPAELDALEIRGDDYIWLIPDDFDTNVASSSRAYDRIVITKGAEDDFAGEVGVDNHLFSDNAVSDHWPVWAKFHVDRDD